MDGDTRVLGSRAGGGGGRPTRRLLLLGGAAAGLAVLVDHGLRVDTPPPPPPVPTRRPAPDEAVLLAAIARLSRLARAAGEVPTGSRAALVQQVQSLADQQLRTLRGRLTNAGVPTAVIDSAVAATPTGTASAAPSPSGTESPATGTPSPTTAAGSRPRTPEALGQLMLDSLRRDDWDALATATPATRQLLATAYAERLAAALLLGAEPPVPAPSRARPDLMARTEALAYAFEVVAAQSTGAQRRAAEATLAQLTHLQDAVAGTTPTEPAGWSLPYAVTTPPAARRLATDTLSAAVDAAAASLRTDATAASLEDTAHWSARIQAQAVGWGLPLTAFPGATP